MFAGNPILELALMFLNTFHNSFTIIFLFCIAKVLFQKYSPYCQLYLAGFMVIQIVWDGCPISDFVNIFNNLGNYPYELNGFFFNFAGGLTPIFRLILLGLCGLLFWTSHETWNSTDTSVDFANYFRKGTFKMVSTV